MAKLDDETKERILDLRNDGLSFAKIAEIVGVSSSAVGKFCKGKNGSVYHGNDKGLYIGYGEDGLPEIVGRIYDLSVFYGKETFNIRKIAKGNSIPEIYKVGEDFLDPNEIIAAEKEEHTVWRGNTRIVNFSRKMVVHVLKSARVR